MRIAEEKVTFMPKVLVIDDIEFTRTTISRMLIRNGYDVVEAANGREGIAFFHKHKPDLVLTDILMPEMEGLETIKSLVEISPKLPVIAITGSTDTPFLDVALKLGATCGLYKPFKQDELIETVSRYVS